MTKIRCRNVYLNLFCVTELIVQHSSGRFEAIVNFEASMGLTVREQFLFQVLS